MRSIAQVLEQPMIPSGMKTQKTQPAPERMNTSKPTSSACNVTDKRIENLFTRFAVFYGHLWRSQFKSDGFLEFAKKEWSEGLGQFSDEILNQAILACRDHCDMPPSLPQMIGFCRDIKRRNTFYVAGEEHQPASQAVVEENIRQCKAYLLK
ncbi:Vir protein [Legionella anisa]|nr:hypothetical protein Lani_0637 [Legionella anisa]